MTTIAALLPDRTHLQRLTSALVDRHSLIACAHWEDVATLCESESVHIVVVDPHAEDEHPFTRLRAFRDRFPGVVLVGYIALARALPQHLFELGQIGVNALVVADHDDAEDRLLALADHGDAGTIAALVDRSLPHVHEDVRRAVLTAVGRAADNLSPVALVEAIGISRRTLSQRLASENFPPPRVLLTWGRLLVAARLLEDDRRSADAIARSLHFPSGTAFRNTLQRYLHATPGQIRARGGAPYVLRVFLRRRTSDGAPREPRRGLQIAI
jgi:AraC-like DNA-binding protein